MLDRFSKPLLVLALMIFYLFFISYMPAKAEGEFEKYLNDFYINQQKASRILKEIETDLKNGTRDRDCERQKKAAYYGIEATEALIKAFKINGSKSQTENLNAGLNKWRELRDFC